MAMNKRKKTTAAVAGVIAAALLLGGTFAWTSISQQAKNEAIVDINPGGRLHDDFNGTNKDVYVENFGDEITGVNIFARIRLDQYFEVGQDAGINKDSATRNVEAKIGEDINDVETWDTYIPGESLTNPIVANTNWQWTLGNEEGNLPYYMPTFNMNKDSLEADINGTYEGTIEGDIVHYDDYTQYGEGSTDTATEVYDHDSNTNEEAEGTVADGVPAYSTTNPAAPIDDAHVRLNENVTHTAKQISTTATVMTMAQWIALCNDDIEGNETGNYWVYDTDGWAYWAQPIKPGETTGLLLDGINMSKVPDDNYYYGINVVGQFATASDWTLLYSQTGEEADAMSDNAKQLMELITGVAPSVDDGVDDEVQDINLVLDATGSGSAEAKIGDEVSVTADETDLAEGQTADLSSVTITYTDWTEDGEETEVTLEDAQYTYNYDNESGEGTLSITDSDLAGKSLTVKDANSVVSGLLETSAADSGTEDNPTDTPTYYTMDVAYPLESGTTVNLGVPDYTDETPEDEVSYYIINKENNPSGGSDTELPEADGKKVVSIVFVSGGGLIQETKYYYAVPFENGSQATTDASVEGVTFAALDGDTLVAYTCTKVYDAGVHTYLGTGNYAYEAEGVMQNVGCLVFESVANPGSYCTLGDANVGVDGDDKFVVTEGVTAADETADYNYDVTTITETPCSCTALAN